MNTEAIEAAASPEASTRAGSSRDARKLRVAFLFSALIGSLVALSNASLPLTRNALCYAKASLGVVQEHFNLLAVARDSAWTSGKPILFPILAAPLVWLLDVNRGMVVTSALGTMVYLWAVALALPRLNRRFNIDPKYLSAEFAWAAANPLVLYQFWSAYPDSLFAGFVLFTFVLIDDIAAEPERDTRPHLILLGLTLLLAIHTKLYGAVLLPASLAYLSLHARILLARSSYRFTKALLLVLLVLVVAMVIIAAKTGLNPLLPVTAGGGYGGFSSTGVLGSVGMLLFFLLLCLQAASVFLFKATAWRQLPSAPWVFCGIYLGGLLFFEGTSYNMRYFLPVLTFVGPLVIAGAASFDRWKQRTIWVTYAAISIILMGAFNLPWMERLVDPLMPQAGMGQSQWYWWLDNLRLPVQLRFERQIEAINRNAPPRATLYWSSDYYGVGAHGLAQHLGLRKDLDVHYVRYPPQIPFPAKEIYGVVFDGNEVSSKMELPPAWAVVHPVGDGLFRLDPVYLQMEPPIGNTLTPGASVELRAKLVTGTAFRTLASPIHFMDGETALGDISKPPYQLTCVPTVGRHELTASAREVGGPVILSRTSVVYAGIPAIERLADLPDSVAVEAQDASVTPAGAEIELGSNSEADIQYTAIYLENVPLSADDKIKDAYLDFGAARTDDLPTRLQIRAELSPHPAMFRFEDQDLSRRTTTASHVNWTPASWTKIGDRQQSPDLTVLLRELAAQPDWKCGNAILFLIHGSGRRVAQGYSTRGRDGPRLHIEGEDSTGLRLVCSERN